MPYQSRRNLSALLLEQGNARANAELQSGQAWAGAVQNLGQIAGRTLTDLAQYKADAPNRAAEAMRRENIQLENAARKHEAAAQQQSQAIQGSALTQNEHGVWTYDRNRIAEDFKRAGLADRLPSVLEGLDAFDKSARAVQQAKQEGLAGLAYGVTQLGNTPQAFNQAIDLALKNGFITRADIGPILQRVGDDPAKIGEVVKALASSSPTFSAKLAPKEDAPFTLSPGQQRFGPDGQPIAAVPATAPPAQPFNLSPGQTRFGPDGKPVASLPAAPKEPTVRYQSREVLNDAGQPVMANYDATTGRYLDPQTGQPITTPKPIPSAAAGMDALKFKKAAPVLASIGELSEKINTLQGVYAKAAGAAAKQAAKVNLDDDVAEYEALISGFTPMVARSLGHTGVLTQQDVDSVKALFPRPGDSKTLRDRKIARMTTIISGLEHAGAVPPAAPTTTAQPGAMPSYQDYLRTRQGAR